MWLPFPFFAHMHERTHARTDTRTQPGVIIDTTKFTKSCHSDTQSVEFSALSALYCPSTLTSTVIHSQLVSKVFSSLTDLRQPQFC